MVIPRVKTSPYIDGKLDDAVWERAGRVVLAWTNKDEKVINHMQSQALAAYDDMCLYIAFLNKEPDSGGAFGVDNSENSSPTLARDDRVELFLEIENIGKGSYFQVGVYGTNMTLYHWEPPGEILSRSQKVR